MKKMSYILLAMLFVFGSVVMCEAGPITTFATSTGYQDDDLGWVTDNYGYSFVISNSLNPLVYNATLTNTSPSSSSTDPPLDPLIDAIGFNMDAVLSTDFDFDNVDPSQWEIINPTGGGILFDYIGKEKKGGNQQDHRLHAGDTLTFDFVFDDTFTFPSNPFDLWLQTDGSFGAGFGGGEDFGQVAVSFQRLGGESVDGSDLLASNWEGGADPQYVIPEPATMLLLGSGLIGFAVRGKKRFKKRNG